MLSLRSLCLKIISLNQWAIKDLSLIPRDIVEEINEECSNRVNKMTPNLLEALCKCSSLRKITCFKQKWVKSLEINNFETLTFLNVR